MADFDIRDAVAGDCADLAILENMASHGLAQWFWQGAVNMGKAEDAFQFGRDRILEGSGQFSWTNSVVAEQDGVILGAAMFYAAEPEDKWDYPDAYVPLAELRAEAVGAWYLDSIALYPNHRGQGVGKALFQTYLDRGHESGAQTASLIAEDSNEGALALYQSFGFDIKSSRPFLPFGRQSDTQNWLLLSAALK